MPINRFIPSTYGHDPTFKLGKFCIDEPRRMRIVAIGAGYSGAFQQRMENIDFTIYDGNAGVGGTWCTNKYPGLSCDIPSHCYQLTFEENDWSAFYAPGAEIRAYLERVVDKYKLWKYIKLQHRITRAHYSESTGKWHLTIKRRKSDQDDWEEFEDTADFIFSGVGGLSRWVWPDIPGLENFKGKVIHSAQWPSGEDGNGLAGLDDSWADKKVAVIGVGSSAIQIVPALQPKVKYLVNYVRGKTWVSATFSRELLVRLAGRDDVDNCKYQFTEKDKGAFKDPEYYRRFRQELESSLNSAHCATLMGNPMQIAAPTEFRKIMSQKLAKKPWIMEHIIPDFPVCCRRLTPGPGYLEALCEDNVDFIPSRIRKVTPEGIETNDGKFQEFDVIVCATGYDTSYHLDFDVIGKDGINLRDHYTPHPRTYLGITVDKFPNWFQSLGPNSGVGAGSLLLLLERQVDFAVAVAQKMQRERLKSIEVKKDAVDDFDQYLETVFGQKCRSWYKVGKEEGRVVALWPGSPLHAARALQHPRWEDFNYELLDGVQNRFHWLGDGNTVADTIPQADKAWYLHEIDYPPGALFNRNPRK
ncbi:hypothetical protein BDQ17DRAFT_1387598 [Cyathus striatus]|nr:hypothetical protein BDQ17DRAFT_1387598 [Cyathus striatus]